MICSCPCVVQTFMQLGLNTGPAGSLPGFTPLTTAEFLGPLYGPVLAWLPSADCGEHGVRSGDLENTTILMPRPLRSRLTQNLDV